MEENFWHERWERSETPFHERDANPLLVKHFGGLSLAEGSRVFVPMCGKTLDIRWLLSHGHRVAGAELSPIAVSQLFAELGVEPVVTALGPLARHSAPGIDIFVGNIFDLTHEALGAIDAVYDRAALVALPTPMRDRYAAQLIDITDGAPQLLISFDYDQNLQPGPPFSVNRNEVARLYRESYDLTLLASEDLKGGLKGKCPAVEDVWLLKAR